MLTIGLYGIPDPRNTGAAHDHAVALYRDGSLLTNVELERITGIKHDNRLEKFLDTIVSPWLIANEPIRFVQANSFLGGTFRTLSKSLFLQCPTNFRPEKLLAPSIVEAKGIFDGAAVEGYTISHELAHIGTCLPFFGEFKPNSLLVHIDGGASVSASSAWMWNGRKIKCLRYSWDELKDPVNNFNDNPLSAYILGLSLKDHLSLPGKLMGLASFGTPRTEIYQWLVDNSWFLDKKWRSAGFREVLVKQFPQISKRHDPTRNSICHDIAACMQKYLEDKIIRYLAKLKKETGATHLYYSGGAALNIHVNSRIEQELGFLSIHIPPAPSDCGLALGAAAFTEWHSGQIIKPHHAFITRDSPVEFTTDTSCRTFLKTKDVVDSIVNAKVVATFFGAGEAGPRALGHRSLLARPDSIPLRRQISEIMKKREWYRPVAPIMLPEVAEKTLVNFKRESCLGKFMLGAWRVKLEWISAFAGAIHADGTVRAQIIQEQDSELLPIFEILQILQKKHGIQGLINTSFNCRGRPIVHTMQQAVVQAKGLGLNAIWMPDKELNYS